MINADDPFASVMREAASQFTQLSFGIDTQADVKASELESDLLGRYTFQLTYLGSVVTVSLPLSGRHQVSNALAATAICLALGLPLEEILTGLALIKPVKGRMLPHDLGRVRIIDDSYNANPASVGVAIDWLKEIDGFRCLVLGDLGELGDNASLLHSELGEYAKKQGIDALFSLGELSANTSHAFGGQHQQELAPLVLCLINKINQLQGDVTVLVKGSRSAGMERVVEALKVAHGQGEFV